MNTERDQYLTEAIGECWHNIPTYFHSLSLNNTTNCTKCTRVINKESNNDFSTWNGFGKLWGWSVKQDWWKQFMYVCKAKPYKFCFMNDQIFLWDELVNPSIFANAIYEFLEENIG